MKLSVTLQVSGSRNGLSLCLNLSPLRCDTGCLRKKGGGKLLSSLREKKFSDYSSMKEKYCKKAIKNLRI